MKRHDPNQGSLFGSDPMNPAPVPVPPERVAAELPGQLFLPTVNIIEAAQAIADASPKGWEFYPGTGAPTYVRRLGRGLAVVKLWGGTAYWSARSTDNSERVEGCEETRADAERAAITALERLVMGHVEAITCAECAGTLYVCQCGASDQCRHECAHDVGQCDRGMCALSLC